MAATRKRTNVRPTDGDDDGRWLRGFLADEDRFDRRAFWRLGSWGVAAVAAVALAVTANRLHPLLTRDQTIATDLAAQSRQWKQLAQDAQARARRLSSAIDTLNADRDRLYARVTLLEQNLDSVTGSIAQQASTPVPPSASTAGKADTDATAKAVTAPVVIDSGEAASAVPPMPDVPASAPPSPAAGSSKQHMAPLAPPSPPLLPKLAVLAPPDAAAAMRLEPPENAIATTGTTTPDDVSEVAVQRTEFGVDLGGATTLAGLRTLWRRIAKANKELESLHPIVSIQERAHNGRVHLRLLAGPFDDAAEAAKLCASLTSRRQPCETSVFDGQRLALDVPPPAPRAVPRHRPTPRPATQTAPPKPARPAVTQQAR